MFVVCNYLDISKNIGDADIVIEDCGEFYPQLAGYKVICKDFRKQDVLEWVKSNTGSRSERFVKQWEIDASKALVMLRIQFKVPSYTREVVENLGGIEKYIEVMKIDTTPDNASVTPVESFEAVTFSDDSIAETTMTPYVVNVANDEPEVPEPHEASVVFTDAMVYEDESSETEDSEACFEEEKVETESETVNVDDDSAEFDNIDSSEFADTLDLIGEPDFSVSNEVVTEESQSGVEQSVLHEPIVVRKECACDCIYNSDGSFKGFTEGQLLNMLTHLRELDSRIALDGLDPEYVMTEEELQVAMEHLEEFSPSIFKAFFLRSVQSAKSETERIRCSQLIDQLLSFLQSLNKG